MAGRVQVPRRGLLRDLRDALLPVAVPHSHADLWHWLRPDTRTRRIACHCPYRPVLHVLLSRFHAKVARPCAPLTAWCQRRRRASQARPREGRLCWRRGMGTVGRDRPRWRATVDAWEWWSWSTEHRPVASPVGR